MTPDEASRKYSVDALGRLWGELRAIGNPNAGEAELKAAIAAGNRQADRLLGIIGARQLGVVPGAEALAAFAAAHMLPRDVFEAGGEREVQVPPPGSASKAPRVMICGSAQDGAGLHGLIEASGGVVAGDCHSGGELSVRRSINARAPLLEAIADRLRSDPAASRSFVDPAVAMVGFARVCRADAAVFSYLPEEEALSWDYPEQKAALEAAGIRVLRLKEQVRPFDVEANRAAVEAFVRGGGA
jgi:hypothetical protein